jgi:hypothetical protein
MENLSDNFEFQQVRATAEAAKITADRTNRGMRILESSVKTQKTYATGSVVIVMCMLLLGIGGVWWIHSQLKAQGSSIGAALGLQQDVEKLSRRMSTAEVALSTYPGDLKSVEGRVDALDKKGATIARTQAPVPGPADPAVADHEKQIAQLNERIQSLQAQHSADTMRLESLRGELALVKQDTTTEFATVRSQIPADTSQDVAGLRADVDRGQADLSSLANRVDRNRSDFEVSEGQAREVVPGILMTIKTTNVGRQEVSGWLYLQHEHRFVYLKDQGSLRPITVYGGTDKQAHDIVITKVRKSYAIGYVLSPKSTMSVSASAGN